METKGKMAMDGTRVRDVMTNLVVTFRPHDEIEHAAKRLLANRISGAPVVESGRLVGIVSEADLVKAFSTYRSRSPLSVPGPMALVRAGRDHAAVSGTIGDVMTTKVVSIKPNATIWQAASLIDRHAVRRLPVVDDDGFVIGVVARADLVRCMAHREETRAPMPA